MNKSVFPILFILIAGFLGIFLTLSYTNNLSKKSDLRTRASNPAEAVVDSDAMLEASERSESVTESDVSLQITDDGSDDSELQELNAL